jgi:xanthine dehydrogenase small subunit
MISKNVVEELLLILQKEISPISDARGTAEYKRLLLQQLVKAHFVTLFPEMTTELIQLHHAEY